MNKPFVTASVFKNSHGGYGLIFKDGQGKTVKTLCNVSEDYDLLLDFAEKCNRNSLSVQHIYDVLEDFLP